MSKIFTALLTTITLVGAFVLAQSVTTSAAVNTVVATEAASAESADFAAASAEAKAAPVAMAAAQAPVVKCYTVDGGTPVSPTTRLTTFEVAKFDPANGKLSSVNVSAAVDFTTSGTVTNPNDEPKDFKVKLDPDEIELSLTGPEVSVALGSSSVTIFQAEVPAKGAATFANELSPGISGVNFGPTDLAAYSGAAEKVTFTVVFDGEMVLVVPKTGDASVQTPGTAAVRIEYCYEVPFVPSSITITKTVTKTDASLPTFNFAVSCSDGNTITLTESVSIAGTGSVEVTGIPAGSTCDVVETAPSSGDWVAATGDNCAPIVNGSGVEPGKTVVINNRPWGGAYDPCLPLRR